MHVPDGFLDIPTSVATGAVAIACVGIALKKVDLAGDDRWAVRGGLTAAFVFAAQMVNFPVAAGTSGHLIGAALATTLLGPAAAVVVMTSVLLVQAFVFADGGITALGTNILLMAVVPVLVAHGIRLLVPAKWQGARKATVAAAAIGAGFSVPAAALIFCLLYLVGGAVPIPAPALIAAMVGVHLLIGIGEAIITGITVQAVLVGRPDLIADSPNAPTKKAIAVVSAVIIAIAAGLSLLASQFPDGLESVAESLGFDVAATDSIAASSPVADYELAALPHLGASVAGVTGVVVTVLVVWLITRLVAHRSA